MEINSESEKRVPQIPFNRIVIVVLLVISVLMIISRIISNERQEDFHKKLEEENLRINHSQDSLKAYEDSVMKFNYAYRDSIQIIKCYVSEPNSAGGVDLDVIWKNNTSKTIKYVSFRVNPVNAVGDVVGCDIRGYNLGFRITGPIRSGKVHGYDTNWSCAWYNHTIRKAKISSVTLTFMDNSQVEFEV